MHIYNIDNSYYWYADNPRLSIVQPDTIYHTTMYMTLYECGLVDIIR